MGDEGSVKGVEPAVRPEFPEAAEMGGAVVDVRAREDLDGIMGVGKGRPQARRGRGKGGDGVVPVGREAIEDEVEV